MHGFRYSPTLPGRDPHVGILAPVSSRTCRRAVSWPRHLGFGAAGPAVGIAFGWEACGSIWRAYDAAASAGRALARTLLRAARLKGGPVDVVAHSLGARVALQALHHLPPGTVGRMILISGAEFRSAAAASCLTPAGRSAEIVNVTSRENDVFDLLLEWAIRPLGFGDPAIGAGLGRAEPNWLDLQIDAEATRRALLGLGFRTGGTRARVCHWSGYLRPGLFPFYGALLRERGRLTLPRLRAALPAAVEPRWSALLPPRLSALALARDRADLAADPQEEPA